MVDALNSLSCILYIAHSLKTRSPDLNSLLLELIFIGFPYYLKMLRTMLKVSCENIADPEIANKHRNKEHNNYTRHEN